VTAGELEDRPGLAALFARQARAATRNGSPLYADLCRAASLDLAGASRLSDVLAPWAGTRAGDMLALRVLGAAHRLVLEREAPGLALWFPSVGGHAPVDALGRGACYAAWVETLVAHDDRLPHLLARPPQTNDPGRGAALAGALQLVSSAYRLPIRLHELGASAGLNLLADRMRVTWPGGAIGPADSPLVLGDAWDGAPLPPQDPAPTVVERVGCDLDPVDVTSTEGRLHLTSFVWPDQAERLQRLRSAYRLGAQVPVTLVREDLVEHLRGLRPRAGTALVVFHSSTWFYLDEAQRSEARDVFAWLGASATPDAPVVHVAREYLGDAFASSHALVLQWWPMPQAQAAQGFCAGDSVEYADSPAHGLPVTWMSPRRVDADVSPRDDA
jgi:hypothetical protein